MVTTIRISRGALLNLRMITNSMSAPSSTATTRDSGTATQNDQPNAGRVISATARLAGTAPRSACAKLITLLDR